MAALLWSNIQSTWLKRDLLRRRCFLISARESACWCVNKSTSIAAPQLYHNQTSALGGGSQTIVTVITLNTNASASRFQFDFAFGLKWHSMTVVTHSDLPVKDRDQNYSDAPGLRLYTVLIMLMSMNMHRFWALHEFGDVTLAHMRERAWRVPPLSTIWSIAAPAHSTHPTPNDWKHLFTFVIPCLLNTHICTLSAIYRGY